MTSRSCFVYTSSCEASMSDSVPANISMYVWCVSSILLGAPSETRSSPLSIKLSSTCNNNSEHFTAPIRHVKIEFFTYGDQSVTCSFHHQGRRSQSLQVRSSYDLELYSTRYQATTIHWLFQMQSQNSPLFPPRLAMFPTLLYASASDSSSLEFVRYINSVIVIIIDNHFIIDSQFRFVGYE